MNTSKILFAALLVLLALSCGGKNFNRSVDDISRLIDSGNTSTAKIELQRLIARYPSRPEPLLIMARLNYSAGAFGECSANLYKAGRLTALPVEYTEMLGISLYKNGNLSDAEKELLKAAESRSSGEVYKYLGHVRYDLGNYEGASGAFLKAGNLEKDSGSLFKYGMSLFKTGENKAAMSKLIEAVAVSPDNDMIVFQAGNLLMLNGLNGDAVEMFARLGPDSKYYVDGLYNSAEALSRDGDYEGSVLKLTEYLGKRPEDTDAAFNLSSSLIKTGKYEDAVKILEVLTRDTDNNGRAFYNLGISGLMKGDIEEASKNFREALKFYPGNNKLKEILSQEQK